MIDRENKIPKFGKNDYKLENIQERLKWIEKKTGTRLEHIKNFTYNPQEAKGNIENLIGTVQIPLAISGPIKVNGDYAKKEYYVPMATTEGALVLNYHIGMVLCTEAGGVNVKILSDKIHISPSFLVENMQEGFVIIQFVENNFNKIKQECERTTEHGKLLEIEPILISKRVVLKFIFDTKDAQGLNMINKATEAGCKYIELHCGKKYNLRSHYSSIKGASTSSYHCGQAKEIFADIIFPSKLLKKYFRISTGEIAKYYSNSALTALYSNRLGHNGHFANGITAIFIACGQDVADVSVSHIGVSTAELTENNDLYLSVKIPNLFVGTVGGGTGLEPQKECLKILNCYGTNKAKKFAEIVASTVLAGEVSVIAALANGNYVNAHEFYGRNKPAEEV